MKNLSLFIIISITAFLISCSTDYYLPETEKFFYPIPQTDLTENVNIGAYYFTHTEDDWEKDYLNSPELGKYNVFTDNSILRKQFDWAKLGGVNFFILSWDKKDLDNELLSIYASSYSSGDPKMVISFNLAHLKATNASPLSDQKLEDMIAELKDLYANHLSKDYYFKVGNQPVVMITSLIPSSNAATAINFDLVMSTIRSEFSKDGISPYFIGELPTGWRAPQTYKNNIITMDAVILSNWAPTDYDKSYAFLSFNDISWKNWNDSTFAWDIDYVPCIFPAFNDSISVPKTRNFGINRSEEFFIDYCNVAKRNLGKNEKFVIVNSWNNYKNSNTLEPASNYGTKYLEILKDQFTIK